MADLQHINILDRGVDAWNQWRKDNPGIMPDLRIADLSGKHLEGINFSHAQLEGANLNSAYLVGGSARNLLLADLRGAFLDDATNLNKIVLSNTSYIGPLLADIHWGGVNLDAVNWSQVKRLGDEYEAKKIKDKDGQGGDKDRQIEAYKQAFRACRQLAGELEDQGLEQAKISFAHRAQIIQRRLNLLQFHINLEKFLKYPKLIAILLHKPPQKTITTLTRLMVALPLILLTSIIPIISLGSPINDFFVSHDIFFLFIIILLYLIALLFIKPMVRLALISLFLMAIFLMSLFLGSLLLVNIITHPQELTLVFSIIGFLAAMLGSGSSLFNKMLSTVYSTFTGFLGNLADYGRYIFSLFLDVLAGYGYRPERSLFWYLVVIVLFAVAYNSYGQGHIQLFPDAFVYSVASFHGRGFFPGNYNSTYTLHDAPIVLAALEAVIGLFIEISFIATFTQRFFGK